MISAIPYFYPRRTIKEISILVVGTEYPEHITQAINGKIFDCLPYSWPSNVQVAYEYLLSDEDLKKLYAY
jgi:hypothetical protein